MEPRLGEQPGAWAELPPDPPRNPWWRRPALRTFLAPAIWISVWVLLLDRAGIGGWRGGVVLGMAVTGTGAAVVTRLCGRRAFQSAGLWATAALLIGVTVGAVAAEAAPWSVGRLDQQIGNMRIEYQLYRRVLESSSGHGWCSPHCPTVVRVYEAPNGSYQEALAVAFIGLKRLGFPGDLKKEYDEQVGLVIRRTSSRMRAVVTLDRPADGRVRLTIELSSRR